MGSVPPCLPLPHVYRCLHGVESSSGLPKHLGVVEQRPETTPQQQPETILVAHLAFQHFQEQVAGKTAMTDNMRVLGQIQNQGARGLSCTCTLCQQTVLSSHLGRQSEYIRLIPRHTPGHPNVSADRLSRRLQIINTRRSPSQQLPTHAWCYTRSPVFSSLRPTNHWMFEARFERSITRRQHRVAPPKINKTAHFQLIMRRLAKLHVDQNVNKTRSIWRKNVVETQS